MKLIPYKPSEARPWNEARVRHLHQRVGFGAIDEEVQRDLASGAEAALDRFFAPAETQLHHRTQMLVDQSLSTESIGLLQAAWINEMWHGGDPLREQLALMWHHHFATSYLKVRSCAAMAQQLSTFRRFARAPFRELLHAVVIDRAMLIWLDGDRSDKDHPNENLARELLELFTLGAGNYTEKDVLNAARALTGWSVEAGQVRFDANRHDAGQKTILGVRKNFDVDSLLDLLLGQSSVANRIAWRICDHFLGAGVATADESSSLAKLLRENNLNVGSAVESLFRSQAFFESDKIQRRFASPASFVVGNIRTRQWHGVKDRKQVLPGVAAIWVRQLGQDLFKPPGVEGWPGGRSWIGAGAMIDRARFAVKLAEGSLFAASRNDLGNKRMGTDGVAKALIALDSQFD